MFECSPYDEFNVKFTATANDGSSSSITRTAVCMYVRREIRSLTDDDLSDAMDAMYTIWSVDEADGQEKYGENYHNHAWFTSAHYFGSAGIDSDYTHGGHGFIPQHVKLSNRFELAMQAVDPSVTLPYWDYTKDATYAPSMSDVYVFQESIFGSLTMPNNDEGYWEYATNDIDDGRIPDGRWKNLKVETVEDYITENQDAVTPFGFLRSPWSANPSEYILRFPVGVTSLSNCANFYNWIDSANSLDEFLGGGDVGPHTPTHWAIGSQFGCDELEYLVDQGWMEKSNIHSTCVVWGMKVKSLFRAGAAYVNPSEDCQASTNLEDTTCAWTCDYTDSFVLEHITSNFKSHLVSNMNDSNWSDFAKYFCEGDGFKVFYGDHREPASPSDPSFWPIHPTLDRAFQAKYLSGGFTDTDWGIGGDSGVECSTKCYVDKVKDTHDVCCYGHLEGHGYPDFITGDKTKTVWETNREYVDNTNPTSADYSMPYVYDHFTWSHCQSDYKSGKYNIDTLLTTLYENST